MLRCGLVDGVLRSPGFIPSVGKPGVVVHEAGGLEVQGQLYEAQCPPGICKTV